MCIACISCCPTSSKANWKKNLYINIFEWDVNTSLYDYAYWGFYFGGKMCSRFCVTFVVILLWGKIFLQAENQKILCSDRQFLSTGLLKERGRVQYKETVKKQSPHSHEIEICVGTKHIMPQNQCKWSKGTKWRMPTLLYVLDGNYQRWIMHLYVIVSG